MAEGGRRPTQCRHRKLVRIRVAGTDPLQTPYRVANSVRLPALHHELLPAGRPVAGRPGHADRQGIVLASALVEHLRRQVIILPAFNAVERASAGAITRANRGASTMPWPSTTTCVCVLEGEPYGFVRLQKSVSAGFAEARKSYPCLH